MLRQVKDHLAAVRQSCGGPARAWDESGPDAGLGQIVRLHERARELRATAAGEQMRLSRSLSRSTDLLSSSAETVRRKVERARELHKAIVAAAEALAITTEEVAGIHLETSHETAIDRIYGDRLVQPVPDGMPGYWHG
jgi:hypothetical protein